MISTQTPAFKEWACVVEALGTGEQILILRKGGIHEKGKKFNVQHESFLLFPTYEHQNAEDLNARGQELLKKIMEARSKEDTAQLPLKYFATVQESIWIKDLEKLKQIAPYHVWSENALNKRFQWGEEAGLFAIMARVFRLPSTQLIANLPKYGGCRSWVDLEMTNPSALLVPVLAEPQFLKISQEIKKHLQ